jgi:hypothetical protein
VNGIGSAATQFQPGNTLGFKPGNKLGQGNLNQHAIYQNKRKILNHKSTQRVLMAAWAKIVHVATDPVAYTEPRDQIAGKQLQLSAAKWVVEYLTGTLARLVVPPGASPPAITINFNRLIGVLNDVAGDDPEKRERVTAELRALAQASVEDLGTEPSNGQPTDGTGT